ncbi:hypothetical protein [Nocardia gipuzkoensis]|uniref:hypothetical protein n=1 Tax=Nocardia gipuzkoensis TaxID=2749991 RepID=UPI00237D4B71|nr:hypothetical protein [Nocardia gipuzkoensis]MDE1673798.1 hypothetical protein [Nocardia gipuzkoensis]
MSETGRPRIGFEIWEPAPEPHPDQIEYDRQCEERERRIAACGDREKGHAWTVVGEPCEYPRLVCTDCEGGGEDAYPGINNDLYYYEFEIGGRTIVFKKELPDEPGSDFVFPVHLRAEVHSWTSMDSIGPEFETVIELTERHPDSAPTD